MTADQTIIANGQCNIIRSAEFADRGHERGISDDQRSVTPVCDKLADLGVYRRQLIQSTNKNLLAAKAIARRALGHYDVDETGREAINKRAGKIADAVIRDKVLDDDMFDEIAPRIYPYANAIAPLDAQRKIIEKEMRKLARQLPVWPWVESVRGFGDLALAVMVGEAGDLGSYPDKHKLWKRFGLTPYNGKAASTWRKTGGLTADEWSAYGYKPMRNAESYAVLGDPLFRQQSIIEGPYRKVYDREKQRFLDAGKTKGHAHNHGLRCMRKAALEDLWRVWNGRMPKQRDSEARRSVPCEGHGKFTSLVAA